jgi:hypothetical protein
MAAEAMGLFLVKEDQMSERRDKSQKGGGKLQESARGVQVGFAQP